MKTCLLKWFLFYHVLVFKQVSVAGPEGYSVSSAIVDYRTLPDQPGSPGKPSVYNSVQPHSLHVVWGKELFIVSSQTMLSVHSLGSVESIGV